LGHQLGHNLKAILLWHPQIEHENVGGQLLVEPASFLPIASLANDFHIVFQPEDRD